MDLDSFSLGQSIDRQGTEIFVSGIAIARFRNKKGEENRTEDTTEKHGDNVEKQRQKEKEKKKKSMCTDQQFICFRMMELLQI